MHRRESTFPAGRPAARRGFLLAALAGLGGQLLQGCDNVSCIFATGCGVGPDGEIGGDPAVLPLPGMFIDDDPPSIVGSVVPDGADVHPDAPIVVVFSESMNPESLEGLFELVQVELTGLLSPPRRTSQVLLAEGRVLVIVPDEPLEPGQAILSVVDQPGASDLTGQRLSVTGGETLGRFTVVLTPDVIAPEVLFTWPPEGSIRESHEPEILAVLDRRARTPIAGGAFEVEVNGAPPPFDPPARPALVEGVSDSRILVFRSVDPSGAPASLGIDAEVVVTLSGTVSLLDEEGESFPRTTYRFRTLPFGTPRDARITSDPEDAIGIANLTLGDARELRLEVEIDGAQAGDLLDVFLFGERRAEPPQTIALRRTRELSAGGTAVLTAADVDLLESAVPFTARLADGAVAFAFRLRRGSSASPIGVLDVEPASDRIDDPVLDTIPPTIDELTFSGGTTSELVSDQRDLVVSGVASEHLRRVEVVAPPFGDNGMGEDADVVASSQDGCFVAAPVALPGGILTAGRTAFTAVAHDAALNASAAVDASYVQRGVVGPDPLSPGGILLIEAFDATTLVPIPNALVFVHGDDGDGVGYPSFTSTMTDPSGRAQVSTPPAPSVGTLITVDADGYDLFTFHGVLSTRLDIPLFPIGHGIGPATSGVVTSSDSRAAPTLPLIDRALSDSRRSERDDLLFGTATCEGVQNVSCAFGPLGILPGRLGVQSFLAGDFEQGMAVFSAVNLIQAFELRMPIAPLEAGGAGDTGEIPVAFLLNDPRAGEDETPVELRMLDVMADGAIGIDTATLAPDPVTGSVPRVRVDALVHGIPGSVGVGLGRGYQAGGMPDRWTVLSARPGAVAPGGFFADSVDLDLLLRVELVDGAGNRSVRRPRLSILQVFPEPVPVRIFDVPVLAMPAPGGGSGGPSTTLRFADTIPNTPGLVSGLYHAELLDDTGRRWRLWTPDPDGAPEVRLHVPAIAGGDPLVDGPIECRLEAVSWTGFDPQAFLWADVERHYDVYASAAPVTFQQP